MSTDGHEQGSEEMVTTVENIPSGWLPDWCLDSMRAQALDPRSSTDGGPIRLLWIHPTDTARRQTLEWLAERLDGPSDRTLHHTLDSLITSLHAELRLPRKLGNDASFQMLLHVACEEAAKSLEFLLSCAKYIACRKRLMWRLCFKQSLRSSPKDSATPFQMKKGTRQKSERAMSVETMLRRMT